MFDIFIKLSLQFLESPLPPQTMLRATGIIRTVDKHSMVSTLHGGGGAEEQFVVNFANRPSIFGQDCLILALL